MQNVDGVWLPTVTEDSILGFFGKYKFLSNFHICPVKVNSITYPSSEHAYMAMKTTKKSLRLMISDIEKPGKVKAFGQTIPLRDNWEDIKVAMMFRVCHAKFSQNPELRLSLYDTRDKYLEETNYWKDTTWGVCDNQGQNLLGKVLMAIREEVRE